jgi:hypothetical protein
MSDDREKAILGAKTLVDFFEDFGRDVYAQILLEELFKGLMYEEALFIFGEQREGRDQVGHSSTGGESSQLDSGECERSELTPSLGEEDSPNCL